MVKSKKEIKKVMSTHIKRDCFAYRSPNRCVICSSMICEYKEKCPFYKTFARLMEERSVCAQRLLAMRESDSETLTYILDTYGMSIQQLQEEANRGTVIKGV